MIQFSSTTAVGRAIPKEAFYKHLPLNSNLKGKFVSDIKRITLSNSFRADTLNLDSGTEVSEILLLTIDLKNRQYDGRILENIARQNSHKLVFLLQFEGEAQLAIYYTKLYTTAWCPNDKITLTINGYTLDAVWLSFLEQIALQDGLIECDPNEDIDGKLQRQEIILKMQKEIETIERQIQHEIQPKKKYALFERMRDIKCKMQNIKTTKETVK